MKDILAAILIFGGLLVISSQSNAAALTSTSTTTTQVGNATTAVSCPMPDGLQMCGTIDNPRGGCGHCNADYRRNWPDLIPVCDNTALGLAYGLDISGNDGQNILLPSVNGQSINWTLVRKDENPGRNSGVIQSYSGKGSDGKAYWLQYNHTEPGSAVGGNSGEVGAKICSSSCDHERHVHMQIGFQGANNVVAWQDPTAYFCKNNKEGSYF